MGSTHNLYVLFSSTPYRMGRWIRLVTGEPYNHVSISTQADLATLYSFARRYYRTPFYGGFVAEHPSRYHHGGRSAAICLYRLPLTPAQWQQLQKLLASMGRDQEKYLYNHLSALAAPLHRKFPIRDAFTCAEFTVAILSALGDTRRPLRFQDCFCGPEGRGRQALQRSCHQYGAKLLPIFPILHLLYGSGFPPKC